jgi:hypothetical protein
VDAATHRYALQQEAADCFNVNGMAHLHHVGQPIMQDEVVSHPDPVRLHGMTQPIVEPTDFRIVEVRHLHQCNTRVLSNLNLPNRGRNKRPVLVEGGTPSNAAKLCGTATRWISVGTS